MGRNVGAIDAQLTNAPQRQCTFVSAIGGSAQVGPEVSSGEASRRLAERFGGRAEILDAAARFEGGAEADFRALLYAPEMHDPDLIIRTSGEQRLSNYLLWQSAYSELIFRDELWPDFTREAYAESLAEFSSRRRRFGGR